MRVRVADISERILPDKTKIMVDRMPQSRTSQILDVNRMVPLLLSTILAEVAGNMVYVTLMERAFTVGDKSLSVGLILVIQSSAQTFLGTWEGTITDRIGIRKASAVGLIGQAILALGLCLTQSIWIVYAIALLTTFARGFIIPARLSLVTRISSRSGRLRTNTAVSVLTGLGLLIGPALVAILTVLSQDFVLSSVIAAVLLFLSLIPIASGSIGTQPAITNVSKSLSAEIRQVWNFVSSHKPLQQVLVCLLFSSIIFGAIVPLLTPLGRQLGLGAEGTGVLVAALGLGWTVGPLISGILIKRSNYTLALFTTGLMTPIAAFTIGFLPSVSGIMAALTFSAIGGAGLNVLVITILQRLTPEENHGSIIGMMQTLSGLVWIISPILISGLVSILPMDFDLQNLFYIIGVAGTLMVLYCLVSDRQGLSTESHSRSEFNI
jgi:MFS family permease